MVLQMICGYHGHYIPSNSIRSLCQVPYGEISLLGLCKGAEALGFQTASLRLSLEELRTKVQLPVILHIKGNHYVVLYKWENEHVWIADPAYGKYKLPVRIFQEKWIVGEKGIALVLNIPQGMTLRGSTSRQPSEEDAIDYWRPFPNGAQLLHIALRAVVLFLSFQWLGILFTSVSTDTVRPNFPIVFGITTLLLIALFLLERQWRLLTQKEAQKIWTWQRGYDKGVSPSGIGDNLFKLQGLANTFQRIEALQNAMLHAVIICGILGYLIWQFWPGAVVLTVLSLSWILYLLSSTDGWRGNYVTQLEFLLKNQAIALRGAPLQLQADAFRSQQFKEFTISGIPWANSGPLNLYHFLGILSIVFLSWWFRVGADSLLVYVIVCIFWGWSIAAIGDGIRAWQLRYFGIITSGNSGKKQNQQRQVVLGDILYHFPQDQGLARSVLVPAGKTTLIMGPNPDARRKLLDRILALEVDEGGSLTIGGEVLDKLDRNLFWEKIAGQWLENEVNFGMEDPDDPDWIQPNDGKWLEILDAVSLGGVELARDRNSGNGNGIQELNQWQLQVANSLYRESEIFVLDKWLNELDSFKQLIFLENISAIRRGKITLVSTSSVDALLVADWVVLLQDGNILDQGAPQDVIQRQGINLDKGFKDQEG